MAFKMNKKLSTEGLNKADPPSTWDKISNKIKHYTDPVNAARLLALGPIGEGALSFVKGQLAGNIRPVGYGKDPVAKFTNALVKPDIGSANWRNKYGRQRRNIQPWELERQDLMSMLMNDGLPSGNSGIGVSNYKPSNAAESSVYYNSPSTEQSILNNLRENPDLIKQFQDRDGVKTHVGYGMDTDKGTSEQGNVLGNYKMTLQKDKEGREYIDYSDVWDLQPFKNNRSKELTFKVNSSKRNKGATKITDALQTAAGVKAPQIYGRVYLDQLTIEDKKQQE